MRENPAGEAKNGDIRLQFDRRLRLEFWGAKITTDAGLLAVRELDEMMGLTDMAADLIEDKRTGKNIQHQIPGLLRQSETRLSCSRFSSNRVRLALFVLAYNLAPR